MPTIDRDRCLPLYSLPFWKTVERELIQLSRANPHDRALRRLLLGRTGECGSGRQ